jgi:hypothetical protein
MKPIDPRKSSKEPEKVNNKTGRLFLSYFNNISLDAQLKTQKIFEILC